MGKRNKPCAWGSDPRYEISGLLGAGGMGEVYRARDRKPQCDVAIKILPPAFAGDPDRLARFEREAQVLAALVFFFPSRRRHTRCSRDWSSDVCSSDLNDDKPYDEFVREQLAGDVLGADVATGFLVGGSNDMVKSPDVVLTTQQRSDELHDMVATTGSAFLGLTVGCARCHNHKFDPIPQVDYFGMTAAFAGVQHGERRLETPDYEQRLAQAQQLRRLVTTIEGKLTQYEPLADP